MVSGMVPFERALVSSYSLCPSLNFSSIFTRFRDSLLPHVLQHATFSHPTSSLPKSSPCSPIWEHGELRSAKVLG